MHSSLLLFVGLVAAGWRWRWRPSRQSWSDRWQNALIAFCLPPLMLLSTAVAVLAMGHHGTMMGQSVSPLGCRVSTLMLALTASASLDSLAKAAWFWLKLRQYPLITLPSGEQARQLDIDSPFAAQVGIWRSALVVSRGWLEQLTVAEQRAMLRHEQAHANYRDPLWFLGLGVVRRFTLWLPQTNAIWEELLLLREMRADCWAARDTEPLLLAELLVKLSRSMAAMTAAPNPGYVGFSTVTSLDRLEQRIAALLQPDLAVDRPATNGQLIWLIAAAVPFLAIGLHR
ncbi:MAG: M56 family metallopeptidase [Nodosilinea sp.]